MLLSTVFFFSLEYDIINDSKFTITVHISGIQVAYREKQTRYVNIKNS